MLSNILNIIKGIYFILIYRGRIKEGIWVMSSTLADYVAISSVTIFHISTSR